MHPVATQDHRAAVAASGGEREAGGFGVPARRPAPMPAQEFVFLTPSRIFFMVMQSFSDRYRRFSASAAPLSFQRLRRSKRG
jgi:hypothetical protein